LGGVGPRDGLLHALVNGDEPMTVCEDGTFAQEDADELATYWCGRLFGVDGRALLDNSSRERDFADNGVFLSCFDSLDRCSVGTIGTFGCPGFSEAVYVSCNLPSAPPESAFACAEDTVALVGTKTGSTSGEDNTFDPFCGGSGGADRVFRFTASTTATYRFSTAGSSFSTIIDVRQQCGGAPLACAVGNELTVNLRANESVLVVVDGVGGATGDYRLIADRL
jgi:hypothetical protein